MKWVCTKINELSHRTGIGNMKLFITVSMVVCGLAGCAAALLLHMLPGAGRCIIRKADVHMWRLWHVPGRNAWKCGVSAHK